MFAQDEALIAGARIALQAAQQLTALADRKSGPEEEAARKCLLSEAERAVQLAMLVSDHYVQDFFTPAPDDHPAVPESHPGSAASSSVSAA